MAKGICYVETFSTTPEQDAEFNDWYDNIHLAEVVARPGFVSARRFAPAGPGKPYVAIYEIESDDIQKSVDDMMDYYRGGGFRMTDAMQTDPPAVVLTYVTTTEFPA